MILNNMRMINFYPKLTLIIAWRSTVVKCIMNKGLYAINIIIKSFMDYRRLNQYLQSSNSNSFSMDEIDRLQAFYDQVNEDHQSYKQSLLVSPYCSKYQKYKEQPQSSPYYPQHLLSDQKESQIQKENSGIGLDQYIQPFNFEELLKTQSKKKKQEFKVKSTARDQSQQQHLKTENFWREDMMEEKLKKQQKLIERMKQVIEEKDKQIENFQRELLMKQIKSPTFSNSPQKSLTTKEYTTCSCHVENLQKEIVFITKNNQQLYEKLHEALTQNRIMEKKLYEYLGKIKEIDRHQKQLEMQNRQLKEEKQKMIKNYEEEIELFMKMKKIWKNKMGKIEKENNEAEQRWNKNRGRDCSWNN